jgi:hypothetical protein
VLGLVCNQSGSRGTANASHGFLRRIDPRTGKVVQELIVKAGPTGIAASGRSIWISNRFAGTISRLTTTN